MPSSTLNGFPAIGTTPGAPAAPKLLRVITRCSTRPEFLSTFGRFVDETSIFVATHQPRPRGVTMPFAIALEDGEAMLRGEAEVIESHTEGDGTQRRPGMRLRILNLDGASRATHAELLARKRSGTVPPPVPTDAPARVEKPVRASTSSTPVESRVPGSSYIVPANPFTELPPEALEYFVECTLYEETMDQPEAPDPLPPPPITPPHGSIPVPSSSAEVPAVAAAPAIVPRTLDEPLAPPRRSIAPVLTALIGATIGLAGGFVTWGLRDEPPAPATAPANPTPNPNLTPPPNPNPTPLPPPSPPPATDTVTATAPVTDTVTAPAPAPAAPAATAPAPSHPHAPPAPSSSTTGCSASVTTEPTDSLVRIDGASAGRTPLDSFSVPCGAHVISIEHARYERVERHVVVTETDDARIDVRLLRPPGLLELHSAPPGAVFTVNGTQAGRSPTTAHVPAYTFVNVRATLDGFGTWTQRVYVLGTKMSLTAPLEPGRRSLKASTKPQL